MELCNFCITQGSTKFRPSLFFCLFPPVFSPSLPLSFPLSLSLFLSPLLFFRRQVRKSWRNQRRESIVGYRHQIFYEFRGGFVRSTNARQGKRENFRIKFLPANFTPRSTRSFFLRSSTNTSSPEYFLTICEFPF